MRPHRIHRSLIADNCIFILIDYQPQFAFTINSVDVESLIQNAVSLARTARIFRIPTLLTTIGAKSFGGTLLPQIQEIFPDQKPVDRSSLSILEDRKIVEGLRQVAPQNLIIAGLWTDFGVAPSTLQALEAGYGTYVVNDACGDLNAKAHEIAMKRMIRAGAVSMTWGEVHYELQHNSILQTAYPVRPNIVNKDAVRSDTPSHRIRSLPPLNLIVNQG